MEPIAFKGLLDDLLKGFIKVFTGSLFKQKIDNYIVAKYNEGLEKAENQFQINFVKSDESLDFLREYVNGNVGAITDQVNNDLRQEIQRARLDGLSVPQMKTRIRELFSEKKYINRINTVVRTEGLRAGNTAQLDAAKQSGLELRKYLDVTIDQNTSNICLEENKKYGTKEEAIPLDQEFVVRVKTGKKMKTYRAQQPPFHPNCRTVIRFIEADEI